MNDLNNKETICYDWRLDISQKLLGKCRWCNKELDETNKCICNMPLGVTYEQVREAERRARWEANQQVKEAERRARWEANQKVKAEEKAKQAEINANSWAAKITKKVSPVVLTKMAENEKKIAAENAAKLAREAEEKRKSDEEFKKRMAETFVPRMKRKYGIKKEFVIPAIKSRLYPRDDLVPEKIIPRGEFWYFNIVGTKDDKFDVDGIANGMRYDNEEFYHAYLKEKYGRNWIYTTEDKEDDCPYLFNKREMEERMREEEDWEWEQQERISQKESEKRMEEEEKEEEEMKRKLQAGEISFKKFNNWRLDKLEEKWEAEDEYHNTGCRIVDAMEREWRADAEWLKRKEAREAREAEQEEEESLHKRLKNDMRKARDAAYKK